MHMIPCAWWLFERAQELLEVAKKYIQYSFNLTVCSGVNTTITQTIVRDLSFCSSRF